MSILTDVRPDGKVLYCIALENMKTGRCALEYRHAKSRADVVNQLLKMKLVPGTRVAWIAPAIGVKYDEPAKGEVKEVFV
jgi:hypothetical protein